MSAEDRAEKIRQGEEPDISSLNGYLSDQIPSFSGIREIRQFAKGFSNLTYLIVTAGDEYVLRRAPFGANIKSAHDMSREFRVLSLLKPHYPKVPAPVLYCEDEAVIGAPFYLMERVRGIILRNKAPEGIQLTAGKMRSISFAAIDNLVSLHELDLASTGLDEVGKPDGYVERQVDGWIRRYGKAQTDEIPEMSRIASWMPDHLPPSQAPAFIHNDYKYDNLVLDPSDLSRIVAVLDWEMATTGDPLMDLGTTLGYWAEEKDPPALKQFSLTAFPGNPGREEILQYYALKSGRDISGFLFYYVYACFKIAVIAQQIYARFKAGYTQDPRFGGLIHVVRACAANGQKALESGRIGN
jgi:aminoglycoside phosphotransferase (APT) family kinase protein